MTFDDVGWMFLVGRSYWGLAVIEGTFVTPMVLGDRLEINPVVLIIGLMLWGWIWGIGGACWPYRYWWRSKSSATMLSPYLQSVILSANELSVLDPYRRY